MAVMYGYSHSGSKLTKAEPRRAGTVAGTRQTDIQQADTTFSARGIATGEHISHVFSI